MKIELLYPELSTLYGDIANIKILSECSENCEIIDTNIGSTPRFIQSNDVNLVYRGTMTEKAQVIMLCELFKYKKEIINSIEAGQHMLFTGNSLELLGSRIIDSEGETIECLDIFHHHARRDLLKRYNSLYVGEFNDTKIVGYKSQFTKSYYDYKYEPLFNTVRGMAFNDETSAEGIRYKNFMSTYLIGPLLILNPDFTIWLANEIGIKNPEFPNEKVAREAYEFRLNEYLDPSTGFSY